MNNWKQRFLIIWTGQLFSILSSNITQFAIILYISMHTGSAEVLALASVAGLVPQIIIGPLAGVLVDRWSRKRTMIGADSFVALCSAVMALLFYIEAMPMWSIYLLLMLRSVGSSFHSPAMRSSVPLLAPQSELTRIAGINQAVQSFSSILGPALGAMLVVAMDMSWIMLIDVAGAVIACTSLVFVAIPSPVKDADKEHSLRTLIPDMREGAKVILKNRGLSYVMLGEIMAAFFLMPPIVLIPLMTLGHFGGDAYQVGLAETLFGVGSLVGGIVLGIWNPRMRKALLICYSYIGFGLAFLVAGLLPPWAFGIYLIFTAIEGLLLPLYTGPFNALLQTQVEPAYLGRAFSLFDSLSLLPSVFGIIGAGFLAEAIGVPFVFMIGGGATAIVGVVIMMIPSVRKMELLKKQ